MLLRGYEAIANCTGRICKVRDCFFTALAVHRNDMAGARPSHCPHFCDSKWQPNYCHCYSKLLHALF